MTTMRVDDILWLPRFVDKIESRHGILPEEVEEVFCNRPKYRRAQRGRVEGENLYYAYVRPTPAATCWSFSSTRQAAWRS